MKRRRAADMTIIGIDPGYAIVGYGVIRYENNRMNVLDFGAITTPAGMEFPLRLKSIFDDMCYLFDKFKPDAMAIEKLFFNTNKTTAVDVAQARGVILLSAKLGGSEVFEYTPLQVKQSVVGYGRAEKKRRGSYLGSAPFRSRTIPPTRWRWPSATPIPARPCFTAKI